MPIPGPHQYMVPCCIIEDDLSKRNRHWARRAWAFNDLWIRKIPHLEPNWPFGSL